jgi:hypothetical protein
MVCARCGGFVVVDRFYAHHQPEEGAWSIRCVNCGNCEDPVIHANRHSQPALRHCARAVDAPSGGVVTVW